MLCVTIYISLIQILYYAVGAYNQAQRSRDIGIAVSEQNLHLKVLCSCMCRVTLCGDLTKNF